MPLLVTSVMHMSRKDARQRPTDARPRSLPFWISLLKIVVRPYQMVRPLSRSLLAIPLTSPSMTAVMEELSGDSHSETIVSFGGCMLALGLY